MLIDKVKYMQGYVRVRLYGYAPERFLNLCSSRNILIWNLEYHEEQYEFCISLGGFRQLKPILRKTRTKLIIVERTGLPFVMRRYRKRKLFFAGIVLCCALLYVMSLFVWRIEVNGNLHETDSSIIKFLKKKKVYHGLLKSKIDCEKIEEELRAGYSKTSTTPLGRSGKLSEVADMVCYLGSEKASYVHGVTFNVAGGKTRG